MFETNRHPGYESMELPPKSDGSTRPANQHGYRAPDGTEWSVMVDIATIASEVEGALPDNFNLIITVARRDSGHAVRVDGLVDIKPHEVPIQRIQLENPNWNIEEAIEDAVVVATEMAIQAVYKKEEVFSTLSNLGVDLSKVRTTTGKVII